MDGWICIEFPFEPFGTIDMIPFSGDKVLSPRDRNGGNGHKIFQLPPGLFRVGNFVPIRDRDIRLPLPFMRRHKQNGRLSPTFSLSAPPVVISPHFRPSYLKFQFKGTSEQKDHFPTLPLCHAPSQFIIPNFGFRCKSNGNESRTRIRNFPLL